jgi:hypothetical protein
VSRTRAADDFATIRARMEELRRERERAAAPADEAGPGRLRTPAGDAVKAELERRYRDRRDGRPPPWVPTIFLASRQL